MIDLSTLVIGEELLVRAFLERTVGSHAHVRVGDGAAVVTAPDIMAPEPEPETLQWCGRTWTVLARDGGEVWMRHGGMRVAVPEKLIDPRADEASA